MSAYFLKHHPNIYNSENNEENMQGTILDYAIQTNIGVISGDDQQRYNFSGSEWQGQRAPTRGDRVDFNIDAQGNATQIYVAINHNSPIHQTSHQLNK